MRKAILTCAILVSAIGVALGIGIPAAYALPIPGILYAGPKTGHLRPSARTRAQATKVRNTRVLPVSGRSHHCCKARICSASGTPSPV